MVLKTDLGAKLVYQIACVGQGEAGRIGSFVKKEPMNREKTGTVASVRPRAAFCSVHLLWFC